MSQIVSDTFTRVDAATLGANWTTSTGFSAFSIVSNHASAPGADGGAGKSYVATYTAAGWTGGADQYSEVTVSAEGAADDGGALARGATANGSGYLADINNPDTIALGSAMSVNLWQISATDVFTAVGTGITGFTVSAGDVIRCEAQGTTITAKINGVSKVTGTNSALASGKPGIRWWHDSAANTVQASLWAAGDFSVGGAVVGQSISRPFPFKPGSPPSRSSPYR